MKQPESISIYDGTKRQTFKVILNPVKDMKYLFTAYSDKGEYFDCFESKSGDAFFCIASEPKEGEMKNIEFIRSSGFSMNCRFYNSL